MTAAKTELDADAGIDRLVAGEQLRMVLAHTALGTVAATAFAVFLAFNIRQGALGALVHPDWVDLWLGVKLAVALARICHAHEYRRRGCPKEPHWANVTIALLALDGVVWGAGGAALMSEKSEVANFASAVVCCIACVATFGLQIHWKATCAYVAPMVSAVVLAYFARGDQVGWMGGVGTAVFLVLVLASARRSELHMKEVFRLRHTTERVSAKLAAALHLAEEHGVAKDQALALAERHNAAREVFLAVVSHELRSPLHSILGLARLTHSELPASTNINTLYRLDLIVQAGEHLRRLLNDLLDVSAMRSGKLEIVAKPFDLKREVSSLEQSYKAQAGEAGLGFSVAAGALGDDLVMGDEVRVTQVLQNLIGNAFKFSRLGGRVQLSVARSADRADWVTFSVSDNGPGIPITERSRIFEMFEQSFDRNTSRPGGVGLGLWISRELAQAMGGDLVCESSVGRGSVFSLSLPLPTVAAPRAASSATTELARRPLGRVVAIADDDPVNRLVTAAALKAANIEPIEFDDGGQLLTAILAPGCRPDAVILDWNMPTLGGEGTTRAIRAYEAETGLSRLPIIVLSATHAEAMGEGSLAVDMDIVLSKPCAPADITAAVLSLLDRVATVR